MDRTAKMLNGAETDRMAKMKVRVTEPSRENPLSRTAGTVNEAMCRSSEAEFNTQPRSRYRNALII